MDFAVQRFLALSPLDKGALGNGLSDDSNALQATINQAFTDSSFNVIDLNGLSYAISKPISIPIGNQVIIRNGKIIAKPNFSGSYLFSTGQSGTQTDGFSNHDIIFENIVFDGNHVAGCISLEHYLRVNIDKCRFQHFNTFGVSTSVDGHELLISNSYFFEYYYDDPGYQNSASYTGTGIYLGTHDNHVTNCVFGYSYGGIKIDASFNLIQFSHIYTNNNGMAILVTPNAPHIAIRNCYIDSCGLTIQNPWYTEITGTKFLVANAASGFAFVTLEPQAGGTYLNGLIVKECEFIDTNAPVPATAKAVYVDTSKGSFSAGNIKECDISANSFGGMLSEAWTKKRKFVYATGATAFTIDFSSYLPFGSVFYIQATIKPDSGTAPAFSVSLSGNAVTVTTAAAMTGNAYIEVDVNSVY